MLPKGLKKGDSVEVKTSTQTLHGIYMPSTNKSIFSLKLKSGYNIGIKTTKIKSIKKQKASTTKKPSTKTTPQDSNLPHITILHTGGTIASQVDYNTGATYSSFTPSDLLEMFPELKKIARIDSALVRNMWSDDLRFDHFTLLGKKIQSLLKTKTNGIIISMGTDNLAVCAAALAFIVQHSPIPIILVGAQRSSDRPSSDAALNLVAASYFISESDFAGVGICMHNSTNDDVCAILPPTKTKKLHTSRRDAFQAIGTKPYALVDVANKKIIITNKKYPKQDDQSKVSIAPNLESKVGFFKISVHMFTKQFDLFKGFKGLVIEGTGLGHMPGDKIDEYTTTHPKFLKSIKQLTDKGTVVVMTSNCLYGNTRLTVYAKGRALLASGVIQGADMLPETAFVKLAWLLANKKKNEVKELIQENLVGEINKRVQY